MRQPLSTTALLQVLCQVQKPGSPSKLSAVTLILTHNADLDVPPSKKTRQVPSPALLLLRLLIPSSRRRSKNLNTPGREKEVVTKEIAKKQTAVKGTGRKDTVTTKTSSEVRR